jgi:hypothetical protein
MNIGSHLIAGSGVEFRQFLLDQKTPGTIGTPNGSGQLYFDTTAGTLAPWYYDGTSWMKWLRKDKAEAITQSWDFQIATGTSPITVTSTTKVTNFNADYLDDYHADSSANANTIAQRYTNGRLKVADPSDTQDAVNLGYMTAAIAGATDPKAAVLYTTAAALASYTYLSNVLTAVANGALSVDGQTPAVNDRIGVVYETGSYEQYNGIYVVTVVGDGATQWVMTRSSDADQDSEVTNGLQFWCTAGDTNNGSGWLLTTPDTIILNTTPLTFIQNNGTAQITAGNGIDKTGNVLSVLVNASTTYTPYGVLYHGSSSTLSATAAGTSNTVLHGNTGGAPTWSAVDLTADVSGILPVANGGTGFNTLAGAGIVTTAGMTTSPNTIPKATGSTVLSDSTITDDGTTVTINTALTATSSVVGMAKVNATGNIAYVRSIGGTNNPGIFFNAVESTGISTIDFSGSTGFIGMLALGTVPQWEIANHNLIGQTASTISTSSGALTLAPASGSNVIITTLGAGAITGSSASATGLTISATGAENVISWLFDSSGTSGIGRGALRINAKSGVGSRIEFEQAGADQWTIGPGAASDGSDFEIYNASGTVSMTILKASNNVGIGTTAPQALLHISGATSPGVMISDTDAGADVKNYEFYTESGKAYIRRLTDAFSGYDPTITFDSSQVGIGTASPTRRLSIKADSNGYNIGLNDSGDTERSWIYSISTGSVWQTAAGMKLQLNGSNGTGLIVDNASNVGIGIAAPGHKLNVYGTGNTAIEVQGNGTASLGYLSARADGDPVIQMGQFGSAATGTTFGIANTRLSVIYTTTYATTHALGMAIGNTSDIPIYFATNQAVRFTIDGSSNTLTGNGASTIATSSGALTLAPASGLVSVTGHLNTTADVNVYGPNSGSAANRIAMTMEGSGAGRILVNGTDVSTYGTFKIDIANASGTLLSPTPFFVSAAGKVGIGTTGPVTLLDVLGATADSGIIHVHSATSTNNNRSALMMSSVNVNGTVGNVSIECIHPNNQQSDMVFRTGSTTQTDFGTERMRIDTSGKVGIGPTTTMTGLLNVEAADSTWLVLSYSDARAAAKNAALRFIDGSEQFMGQLTYTSDGAANNASTLSLTIGNGSGGSQTVLTALSSGALTLGGSAYTTAGGILQTNGSGVVSAPASIPTGTTIGSVAIARFKTVACVGDNINEEIDVTHSLSTLSPVVTVWEADGSNDATAVAIVDVTPLSPLAVRLTFSSVQTTSDHYVVAFSG